MSLILLSHIYYTLLLSYDVKMDEIELYLILRIVIQHKSTDHLEIKNLIPELHARNNNCLKNHSLCKVMIGPDFCAKNIWNGSGS